MLSNNMRFIHFIGIYIFLLTNLAYSFEPDPYLQYPYCRSNNNCGRREVCAYGNQIGSEPG